MTIEVKSTKAQPQETDPSQRYVLKDAGQKVRTPAIIGTFLLGVALYLKSIFPTSEAEEQSRAPGDDAEGGKETMLAHSEFEGEQIMQDGSSGETDGEKASSSAGNIPGLASQAQLPLSQPTGIRDLELASLDEWWGDEWWNNIKPLNRQSWPANDNVTRAFNPTHPGTEMPGGSDDGAVPSTPEEQEPPSDGGDGSEDDEDGANRAPRISGPVYLMDVTGCAIFAIGLSDLLQHAADPDGDVLAVRNLTVSSGTISQSGDEWLFQGEPSMFGPVTISYEITDGDFVVTQTAHFSVVRSFINGTVGDDLLLGSMCADDMDGGLGNDNMDGRDGDDIIAGGAGDDQIVAGAGNDVVFAGVGDDIVFGGEGNDHISGGEGNDRLFGDQGDDVIFGDAGHDRLVGGEGDDFLSGGEGNDTIFGEAGTDIISGGSGDDVLNGGAGPDVVHGDSGDDLIVAAADSADDFYDGGAGCDTLDYSAATEDLTLDLVAGTVCSVEVGEDSISGFEAVIGGQGNDHFLAGETTVSITGGGGNDVFEFVPVGPGATSRPVVHEIIDFEVGDRLRMSQYDLFEEVLDEMEDHFETIYGDDFDDDDIPIRVSHDSIGDVPRTVVEADINRDDIYEMTVIIEGRHALLVIETV
jgi:Ca2+-binding RTX toxin-like protein